MATTTEVKERPIRLYQHEVRGVLRGRQTQLRRVMKPQPSHDSELQVGFFEPTKTDRNGMQYPGKSIFGCWNDEDGWKCPYGSVGDRLWVREAFAVVPKVTDDGPKHKAKGDGTGVTWKVDWNGNPSGFKWKPSIHMPRWASRITLEITGVRVERLNDISEEDAAWEGVEPSIDDEDHDKLHSDYDGNRIHINAFAKLWESINGEGSWAVNPWVWVIEFKRCE